MLTDAVMDRIVREISRHIAVHIAAPRMATVTSYDPEHGIKAKISPEGDDPDAGIPETGFIPLSHGLTGSNWGIYAPPSPGDQVMLLHSEHDHGSAVCIGRINDEKHPAPSVPAAEVWAIHKSGSCLRLTNDGKVLLNGQVELDLTGQTIVITGTGDSPSIVLNAPGGSVAVAADSVSLQGSSGVAVIGNLAVQGSIAATGTIGAIGSIGGGTGAGSTPPQPSLPASVPVPTPPVQV